MQMEVSGKKSDAAHDDSFASLQTCDPCESTGETQKAECFCTECEEYLCSSCTKAHRKLRVAKDHLLLGQDEMPKQKPTEKTEMHCKEHAGKLFDYFCKSHNIVCCMVCVTLEHRECNVEYIKSLIDKFETSGEYEALKEKIVNLDADVCESISKVQENIAAINKWSDTIIVEVGKFRKEINAKLDVLERELLEGAKKIKDEDIQKMVCLKSDLYDIQQELHETTKKLDSYETLKQTKQLVIASKLYQATLAVIERKLSGLSERNKFKEMKFNRNEDLLKSLNSINDIGSLAVWDENKIGTIKTDRYNSQNIKDASNQQQIPLNIFSKEKINAKMFQDEGNCHITGMKVIDSTTIALADYANSSIKVINLPPARLGIRSYIKLDADPWGITLTEQNQLVVTAPDIKSLIFVNNEKALTVRKTMFLDGECYGIESSDNMLIVSFVSFSLSHGVVKFLNMDGQIIKSIFTNSKGKQMFVVPFFIAISQCTQDLYVSDWDWNSNTVTKLDEQGSVLDVYSNEVLEEPHGISVDKYGNLYIAGWWSHNICVLAVGSREIKHMLHFENPVAIGVCKESDQMFVSQHRQNDIFWYKLKYTQPS